MVEDLGSANGTFVNGERINGRRVLNVGDSLRVGSTTLQLTDGDAVPRPRPPAARAARAAPRRPLPPPPRLGAPVAAARPPGAPRALTRRAGRPPSCRSGRCSPAVASRR